MAVSIESRVPLLDYRIAEFLATVPPEQKAPGLVPKSLLRAIGERVLPPEVLNRRDKSPFPVPVATWMSRELKSDVRDILLSPASLDRGVFDPDELRHAAIDASLWPALNVEMWFRLFIDRDPEMLSQIEAARTPGMVP